MTLVIRLLLLGLLLCPGSVAHTQSTDVSRKIDALVRAYAELEMFSGTVLVAQNGATLYAGAFGESNRDHHIPNQMDTRFNIGSIGKTVTAVAVMQLVEAGKLKLSDSLSRFLPDLPFPERDAITVQHLLSHSSGLGDHLSHKEYRARLATIRTIRDALPLVYDQRPTFSPGERYQYSNAGYLLLGAIVEKVSGEPYREYIRKHVFEPAGMTASGIVFEEEVLPHRSIGYTRNADGSFTSNILGVPAADPAGGLRTTAGDLLKFDQALRGTTLLSEEAKRTMFTPTGLRPTSALGWMVNELGGQKLIGASGGSVGVQAVFYRFVETGHTLIMLSNIDDPINATADDVANALFGHSYVLPSALDANFSLAYRLQSEGATAEAVSVYARNARRNPPHRLSLFLSAQARIRAGIDLEAAIADLDRYLRLEGTDVRPAETLRLLERMDPPASMAWRAKAGAWKKLDRTQEAIRCYEKALELDPGSEEIRKQLDALRNKK